MLNISKLKKDLIRDEGLRLKPYVCSAGKLTIGIGRNLEDNGISEIEADSMLFSDISDVMMALDMGTPYWKYLSEPRQRALANMCFNLGLSRFMNFQKMLKCIREKDFEGAAEEALDSKWARQVGSRAHRIAELIRKG